MVLIVVDALRWDFVDWAPGLEEGDAMPWQVLNDFSLGYIITIATMIIMMIIIIILIYYYYICHC